MPMFDHDEFEGHEQVVHCGDASTGLRAIIAIHNTNRGPSLGGCRMWAYETEADALEDALRLSKGMTYKAAIADLPLGGGKSVIIGDAKKDKSEALMLAFGRHVEHLGRRYITAEDVGTTVADMDLIKTVTDHVVGITGGAGDPSNSTAHGVFIGIEAAVRHKLGKDSVKGLTVAVQGVGSVGGFLCSYLHKAGANLIVTDINEDALKKAESEFGAKVVGLDEIYGVEADIFAPCALGATVNDDTIDQFKTPIIAGSANNVLDEDRHGSELRNREILYAPDYVINAGGLIDVARFAVGFGVEEGRKKLFQIGETLTEIFGRAEKEARPTSEVADVIAEERVTKPA
jgi:leucine dehydrogenase